jgi:hypothetical protein
MLVLSAEKNVGIVFVMEKIGRIRGEGSCFAVVLDLICVACERALNWLNRPIPEKEGF